MCRPRPWLSACCLVLAVGAAGRTDEPRPCAPPCGPVAACPPKIIVEVPPAIVTFKQSGPTCVKAPGRPCGPESCGQSMMCFPFTLPAPAAPQPYSAPSYQAPPMLYAAPAPLMAAPGYALAPAPMAATPGYALAPVAAPGYALAPAPAMGVAPTGCGAAGYSAAPGFAPSGCGAAGSSAAGLGGAAFGLGGMGAGELEAAAAGRRAYEETMLRGRMAELSKAQNALASHAASYGISLEKKDAASGTTKPAAAPGATPAAGARAEDPVLRDLAAIRKDISLLQSDVTALQLAAVALSRRLDTLTAPPGPPKK